MLAEKDAQNTCNEKGFKNWVKRNKDKIIIGLSTVASIAAGVFIYKNRNIIEDSLFHNGIKKGSLSRITPGTKVDTGSTTVNNYDSIIDTIPTNNKPDIIDDIVNNSTPTIINDGNPFPVNGFVRDLPEGSKASPEKIKEALELGIELGPNQTYVDPYYKNVA